MIDTLSYLGEKVGGKVREEGHVLPRYIGTKAS